MYRITAEVDTVKLMLDWGPEQCSIDIPAFYVEAGTKEDALVMAKLIIDPLRMCDTHVTVEEMQGEHDENGEAETPG